MRRYLFHSACREALERDGWLVTADPIDLTVGAVELFADLGAERMFAAEREHEKIAVEIKSFVGQSPVSEFHKAVGQYENYRLSLEELDPNRRVVLAIPEAAWLDFFQRPFIQKAIERFQLEILVFNPKTNTIVAWIK
jgi:XisH protein